MMMANPPAWLLAWADVISKLAPAVIAVAAAFIAYAQWTVARSKLQTDLLDRRLAVRARFLELIDTALQTDEATLANQLKEMRHDARRLFGRPLTRMCDVLIADCNEAMRLREFANDPVFADQRTELEAAISREKQNIVERLKVEAPVLFDRFTRVV